MFCQKENAYKIMDDNKRSRMDDLCERYKKFLSACKTEREATDYALNLAQKAGFAELYTKQRLKAGDKVYRVNRGRGIFMCIVGNEPIINGVNLIAAHIDSPRIDLKQNPLYESEGLALLKTHYYGGIKKYQWTAIPLEMRGVVITANGEKININIREPLFTITDLLPHLAKEQMEKKMSEGVQGEGLNLLVGNEPLGDSHKDDKEKENVKKNILKILKEQYKIEEQDFISAEIEIVPAFDAVDIGFDRSMIGSYGQDDRVCAFTSLDAMLACESPNKTAILMLADKEEVGSMGNTGMKSHFFEDMLAEVCARTNPEYNDILLRRTLNNSVCLSADVGAAMDPNYTDVLDKYNAPRIGNGVLLTKYTGSRGKSGSNDASAELVGKIRALFDANDIAWQAGELGKVDMGGGGTVAQFLANLGLEVIDCGVPLLSMHSPFEISAKVDVFMAHEAYAAFWR